MKSILIIGMGKFGQHLAERLVALGNEVMIVDENGEVINELSSKFENAYVGDCTKKSALQELGINNFDVCVVAIGENFQASLEITSLLSELGAKYVISKAKSDIQLKFLLKSGANEVVYPEMDIAEKVAVKLSLNNIFDYTELSSEYSVFEISVLKEWVGQSITNLDIRRKYNVNIIAVKKGKEFSFLPGADYIFEENDHILLVGKVNDVAKLTK